MTTETQKKLICLYAIVVVTKEHSAGPSVMSYRRAIYDNMYQNLILSYSRSAISAGTDDLRISLQIEDRHFYAFILSNPKLGGFHDEQ